MALAAYDEKEDLDEEELNDPSDDEDSSPPSDFTDPANAEQSAMDRVNETFAERAHEDSFLSPSEKEETDMSIANAMDRADIGNRFGFDSKEYKDAGGESTGLSGIPDRDKPATAGKTSGSYFSQEISERRSEISAEVTRTTAAIEGLANRTDPLARSQRQQLVKSLNKLEKEDQGLLRDNHRASIYEAKQADERVARDTHTRAANGYRKLSIGLAEINSTTAKGPEYDKKVANWIIKHKDDPDVSEIMGTKGFEDKLKPHLDSSKATTDTVEKLKKAGYGAEVTHVGPQGASYKITPPTKPGETKPGAAAADLEKDLKNSYGLTKTNLQNPIRIRAGKLDEKDSFTNQYTGAEKGEMLEIATGKGETKLMTRQEYFRYADALGIKPPKEITRPEGGAADAKGAEVKTVKMLAPDGKTVKDVPESQIEYYIKKGASRVQ